MSYRSVNGQPVDRLGIDDRGLLYGDGLFETMAARGGRIRLLPRHLERLQSGCARLGIDPPPGGELQRELRTAAEQVGDGVVKLIVTRGSGGRGYRAPSGLTTTRIVSTHPVPDHPADLAQRGIRMRTCQLQLAAQPRLAGLKHLNRLEQVLARSEWQDPDITEGLLFDQRGQIISGTMSNVFLVVAGELLTPELAACGVAGVMRAAILARAGEAGWRVAITSLTADALDRAEEVFVTNALIGAWPVVALDAHRWPVGDMTRRVQDWIGTW